MSEHLAGCRCFLAVWNWWGLVTKRQVILDSSKPFIPNLGCKRKVTVTLSLISLLEVVRVILELLIAGKLQFALKTCSACNECIQQHRCVAGASLPKGTAHPQAHCKPGALVPGTWMREWAQPSFPSSSLWGEHSGMGTKAGCKLHLCPWQAHRICFCGYWMVLMVSWDSLLLLERKIFSIPVMGKYTGESYLGNLPIAAY